MLQRVMPDLMGPKNVLALNDEAHHCHRKMPEDLDTCVERSPPLIISRSTS